MTLVQYWSKEVGKNFSQTILLKVMKRSNIAGNFMHTCTFIRKRHHSKKINIRHRGLSR